jgi:hypothetical protein
MAADASTVFKIAAAASCTGSRIRTPRRDEFRYVIDMLEYAITARGGIYSSLPAAGAISVAGPYGRPHEATGLLTGRGQLVCTGVGDSDPVGQAPHRFRVARCVVNLEVAQFCESVHRTLGCLSGTTAQTTRVGENRDGLAEGVVRPP